MQRVLISGPVSWNLMIHVAAFPRPEPHQVFADWHHEAIGGTSAGKALNLARLGVPVTLRTVVGDDEPGRRILAALDGIDLLVTPSANGSERHTNLMDGNGQRLSIYLNLPSIEGEAAVPALDDVDVVVTDLAEISRPVLRAARAAGKEIWTDLHDWDTEGEFQREFAETADVIFASADRLPDPVVFMRDRIDAGARLVVCTFGAEGAIALERGADPIHVPAERVDEVVDTNGAGDAFFAGVLAGRLRGIPLPECLREGARAGAAAVRSRELAG
ncbi:sugar/nucleoside kinase (ribokinase family) [Actinoplanes lutulentus]|uniref:Sugar/nucleoside kinase (Ribokinase family) n=1 Tax=Actinoplanes lutulentus TaxID=1287878 RepID=A0A327ZQR7_9ACTN|nr:carbohydrate kinase family protein [Actinoplanes lutulentus]MBB2940969.1 sugar/nucleoside kinase (ribokinase family) [Actinoplanes lutulentus]RAK43278.1 sugar/nucleoside kinase (ribokinase family) [Actinoplanes lutulentus]